MTHQVVLDASALLALLNKEPGYQEVEKVLIDAVISSVNLTEVLSVLTEYHISQKIAEEMILGLIQEIVPFDQPQALMAAALRKTTKSFGLSLGDRACLALAKSLKTTVLTSNKVWNKVSIPDVVIQLIR